MSLGLISNEVYCKASHAMDIWEGAANFSCFTVVLTRSNQDVCQDSGVRVGPADCSYILPGPSR